MNKKNLFSLLFGILIIGFLAYYLAAEWKNLPHDLKFDYPVLAVSLLIMVLHHIIDSIGWRYLVLKMGHDIPLKKSIFIRMVSNFGRFIPGSVWIFISRAEFCRKYNIPIEKTTVSTVYDLAFSVIAAFIVGLFSLVFIGLGNLPINVLWFIPIIPVVFAALHPKAVDFAIRLLFRLMKKEYNPLKIKYSEILKIFFAVYVPSWAIAGLAFVLFVKSFQDVSNLYLVLPGLFTLSWLLGYVAFVIPGGLGVREGILTLMLSPFLPTSVAILIALLSRIWIVASEAVATIIFLSR